MEEFDDVFAKLKAQLEEQSWPGVYFFKFIVPSDNQKISQVNALFDDTAEVSMKPSSNGKFTSVSIKTVMLSVDDILEIYRKAGEIEGIISL
jgi:hypothetical protein